MTRLKMRTLSLVAVASLILTGLTCTASAGSCKSGSCSGSSGAAKAAIASAQKQIKNAKHKLEGSNGSIAEAYQSVLKINAEADKKSVASLSAVKEPLMDLVQDIEKQAAEQYLAAKEEYDAGNRDEALAVYKELAELDGLAAAKRAKAELRKEEYRVQWRELLAESTSLIDARQFNKARKPLVEMARIARSAGYYDQTKQALSEMEAAILKEIAEAEQQIEDGQFDTAYNTLRAITQLSPVRVAATKARKVLKENATVEGMRLAQQAYEEARRAEREAEAQKRAKASDRNTESISRR